MQVFPGDPEVDIVEIHTLEKEGWRLRQMTLTTHIGTHVNVPYHMVKGGEKLDHYPLNDLIAPSILYDAKREWMKDQGVIFTTSNISADIAEELIKNPPKFIGLSDQFEFDIELERKLLESGIISFENLAHTELLPQEFTFYGIPLNIPGSDGSPVRAFAIV